MAKASDELWEDPIAHASFVGSGQHGLTESLVAPSERGSLQSQVSSEQPGSDCALATEANERHTGSFVSATDAFGCGYRAIVALFFALAFFVYLDRGGLASALSKMQKQLLNDSSFQAGCLASSYLFGFCLSSPMFATLGNRFPPLKMSSLGLICWSIGAFLTGLLSTLPLLICARLLTGIGEASFLCFSSTIIDVVSPNESRAFWLGIYFMAIPLGYAFGYAGGGIIVSSSIYHSSGQNESWRALFIGEALLMFPLAIALSFIKGPSSMVEMRSSRESGDAESLDFKEQCWRIVSNRTWVCCSLGYATQTFVTGTFAVLCIEYMQKVYGIGAGQAGTMFGIATLVSGLVGSFLGGAILDRLKARIPEGSPDYRYLSPTMSLLMACSLGAWPLSVASELIHNLPVFLTLIFLSELLIFISTGPANNAVLWSVSFRDRTLAAALNTFVLHALGDALAPVLVGGIVKARQDAGDSDRRAWNTGFGVASSWLFLSGLCYYLGRFTLTALPDHLDRKA